jgi:hypothetical protein
VRTAVLNIDDVRLALSALKQTDGATVVSNPKIIVANGYDFDCVNDAYVRLMVPLRVKGFDKRRDARKTDDGRWSLTDEFMDAVALQMMIDRDRDSEAVFARKMDEDDDALARWVMNEWLPMRNSRTPPVDEGCGAC